MFLTTACAMAAACVAAPDDSATASAESYTVMELPCLQRPITLKPAPQEAANVPPGFACTPAQDYSIPALSTGGQHKGECLDAGEYFSVCNAAGIGTWIDNHNEHRIVGGYRPDPIQYHDRFWYSDALLPALPVGRVYVFWQNIVDIEPLCGGGCLTPAKPAP